MSDNNNVCKHQEIHVLFIDRPLHLFTIQDVIRSLFTDSHISVNMCYDQGNSISRGASKMSLGERIKKLRNEKNLSQEKFGKQTGIHPNHVGKYEANKTVPSADKLRKIVVISENDKPLAKIVPVSDQGTKRTAGLNKGKIWVSDDFDDSLPDDFWMGSL